MKRSSSSRRIVQAELTVQYQGSRARSITQTSRTSRSREEQAEILSATSDLRALGIINEELYPSRYKVAWDKGQVRVGWRVPIGSREHRSLQYAIQNADEKSQSVMEQHEIVKLEYREDSILVSTRDLLVNPPPTPVKREAQQTRRESKENRPSPPPRPTPSPVVSSLRASSPRAMHNLEAIILPPLQLQASGSHIRFEEVIRPTSRKQSRADTPDTPPLHPRKRQKRSRTLADPAEDQDKSAPPPLDPPLDPPQNHIDKPEPGQLRRKSKLEPVAVVQIKPAVHEKLENPVPSPVSETIISRDLDNVNSKLEEPYSAPMVVDPPVERFSPRNCDSPMPAFALDAQEQQELLTLKIRECSRLQSTLRLERQQHADTLDAEKRRFDEIIGSYESRILVLERSLAMCREIRMAQEADLIAMEVKVTQLYAFLDEAHSLSSENQDKLIVERQERERLAAMLDSIRKERKSPMIVPALMDAFFLVDRLTGHAVETSS